MEKKPGNLLVLFLGKVLNGIPLSYTWQTDGGIKQSTNRGQAHVKKLPYDKEKLQLYFQTKSFADSAI